jgi:hypothetical protein
MLWSCKLQGKINGGKIRGEECREIKWGEQKERVFFMGMNNTGKNQCGHECISRGKGRSESK